MHSPIGNSALAAVSPVSKAKPGLVVGIDLGTSYSAIARLDQDGRPVLLPNSQGQELTSSTVLFAENDEVRIGERIAPELGAVITAVKRHMGRSGVSLLPGCQRLTPEVVSALILKKLAADAGYHGGLASVILTVPSYFFSPGRLATLTAGLLADLPVVELLAEPTAAVLSHLWQTDPDFSRERTLLVFDLGGGTFDVSIVRAVGGGLCVAATEGDNSLGGIDWTDRMVQFAADKFRRRHGSDPRSDQTSHWRLLNACEAAKCRLTDEERVIFDVCHNGVKMPLGLSRQEFGQLTADLTERAKEATEFLFESSGFEPDEIDDVLLVGGGSKMSCMIEMMQQVCGRPVTIPADPQRAVAEGAAIYAAAVATSQGEQRGWPESVCRRLSGIALQDVNAHSLGIALDGPRGRPNSRNHILIPRNTPLPKVIQQRFVTSLANPEGIAIRLLEGESPEVAGCTAIGDWRITGLPPNLPAHSPVQVVFTYNRHRQVIVEARELTNQTEARVERVYPDTSSKLDDNRQLLARFRLAVTPEGSDTAHDAETIHDSETIHGSDAVDGSEAAENSDE